MCPLRSNQDPAPSERSPLPRKLKSCNTGGLDLTGKAAVLKTAGRKPVQVRVLCPPLSPVTPCGPGLIECARAHLPVLSRRAVALARYTGPRSETCWIQIGRASCRERV